VTVRTPTGAAAAKYYAGSTSPPGKSGCSAEQANSGYVASILRFTTEGKGASRGPPARPLPVACSGSR
jgi:hypothetical protein